MQRVFVSARTPAEAAPLSAPPAFAGITASQRVLQGTGYSSYPAPHRDTWHMIMVGFDLILLLFCGWALLSTMAATLVFA